MAKVACVLGTDFEDSEFQVPVERLRAAGHQVDVIGSEAGETLEGMKGQVTVTADKGIDDIRCRDYDLLLIPGGYSPDHLRADQRFVEFVRAFEHTGKPIAAICHGPQLLAAAHLVQGRTLTAWQTVQDDLAQMGAIVEDRPVVVDGNWITSRKPADIDAFGDAILEQLQLQSGGASQAA